MTTLSIIVPVLNEADGIAPALAALAPLRQRGVEVIVADGGSTDGTIANATPLCDRVVSAPRGRAMQMNAGAAVAAGDTLLFLHADTALPDKAGELADELILTGLAKNGKKWGRFDVEITGRHPLLPMVAVLINLRSRLSGIATGDQAMFITREAFTAAGGFPEIPLMEDIEFSRRLKHVSPPLCLRARVRTSGRRWDTHGLWFTIFLMWRLRLSYFLGASPETLAQVYGYGRRKD